MSVTTTILVLVLYPLLSVLPFNPVRFQWGLRRGLTSMPPEVREKAESVDRTLQLLTYVTLVIAGALFLRGSSISVDAIGLSAKNWKSAIALGVLVSILSVGFVALFLPADQLRKDPEAHGSLATSCALRALGSFAVESWRALCIVALIRLDFSASVAVLITVLAYQAPQLITSNATALGAAVFGAVTGFLFVKTGSLLAPLTTSLTTTGIPIFLTRQAPSRSVTCPICSARFDPGKVKKTGICFNCPECDELLEYAPPGSVFSGVWFPLCCYGVPVLSYSIGYRDFTSIVISIGVALLLFLNGIGIYKLVMPPEARQALSYGDGGLHLTEKTRRLEDDQDSHKS